MIHANQKDKDIAGGSGSLLRGGGMQPSVSPQAAGIAGQVSVSKNKEIGFQRLRSILQETENEWLESTGFTHSPQTCKISRNTYR